MTTRTSAAVWQSASLAMRVQAVLALAVLAGCIVVTALLVSTPMPARDTGAGGDAASAGSSPAQNTVIGRTCLACDD